VRGIDEADHTLEPPGLLQAGPKLFLEVLRLLIGIGLGRDQPHLAELHPHPREELADLGRPAADANETLDVVGGLGGRAGRILAEVVLQGLAMIRQVAGGHGEVEPLDALVLELAEIGPLMA